MMDPHFWKNKKVFVTGHTGFKGTWLCLWLHSLGASITGYSLNPPTQPSLYELCKMNELISSHIADIRNLDCLYQAILDAAPDIVIHLAAQSLVGASFHNPVETYETNMMGTVHILEAVRKASQHGIPIKAVINVTTDKCYYNQNWPWGYRESDPLGGADPYSSSKTCSEWITASYRSAYFNRMDDSANRVALASARAGNVIGGGDWAEHRLIPDCVRALLKGDEIKIRFPEAIRPWQHVLEPLNGYLMLAQRLTERGAEFAESWNFGPNEEDMKNVEWIVKHLCNRWGKKATYRIEKENFIPETRFLKLDCSKAKQKLSWNPHWNLNKAIEKIIQWTQAYQENQDMRQVCLNQIQEYVGNQP